MLLDCNTCESSDVRPETVFDTVTSHAGGFGRQWDEVAVGTFPAGLHVFRRHRTSTVFEGHGLRCGTSGAVCQADPTTTASRP